MIVQTTRISLIKAAEVWPHLIGGQDISRDSVYLDLEHYIYRKPVCIGIFGAAAIEGEELVLTQYFLENRNDLKVLIHASHNYLEEKRRKGYENLVTFAGQNDLMMLHAMFKKFHIDTDLRKLYRCVDLQSEFKHEYHAVIGLTALEKFAGLHRSGPEISGSTIAKTFANIMADPQYLERMPKEKIGRLLAYNQMDVENLYFILSKWGFISDSEVAVYMEAIRSRNLAKRSERANREEEHGSRPDEIIKQETTNLISHDGHEAEDD